MSEENKNISTAIPRADGKEKAEGRARYIADYPHEGMLTARFYRASVPRGVIKDIRLPDIPDGYYVIDKSHVTGENSIALINKDWPAFAEKEVRYIGQIILLVAGPDPNVVDSLLSQIKVNYDETTPAITLFESEQLKGGPIHNEDNVYADISIEHGQWETASENADSIIEGTYSTGFQEQLYLEPQGLIAWSEFNGKKITIKGSLQCPYYVKHAAETILGEGIDVRVIQATTGGAFGGKEDYPEIIGAPLAIAALVTGKPLRLIFDRTEDLAFTSKRHPSQTHIRTAHDKEGGITGISINLKLNGGAYESYSTIVLQRALFHSTGVYRIPNISIRGRAYATNTVPSGAFRGFGAPQAIFAIESHIDRICSELHKDPLEYRKLMLVETGDKTVTGGKYREKIILPELIKKADEISGFSEKYKRYTQQKSKKDKYRGIGISMFNHGCGFTGDGEQAIIKAEVALKKRSDGKIEILVANIDMGQGPKTTFTKLVSRVMDIPISDIIYENPDTDVVPDSGPTVASRTMMVVGYLVMKAAEKLKAAILEQRQEEKNREITVHEHYVMPPGMNWDQKTLTGDAYAAYGWGVNVIEVEIDPVTYECTVTGAWGVYDTGVPIDLKVVYGQIQGGMSQALGYGCIENCVTDSQGVFRQKTMADYIVPTSLDFPRTESSTINNPYEFGPFGAKGAGEMVHDGGHAALAAAVSQAIGVPCPQIPLTPEKIMEFLS